MVISVRDDLAIISKQITSLINNSPNAAQAIYRRYRSSLDVELARPKNKVSKKQTEERYGKYKNVSCALITVIVVISTHEASVVISKQIATVKIYIPDSAQAISRLHGSPINTEIPRPEARVSKKLMPYTKISHAS